MVKGLRKFWSILVEAGEEFSDDHATKLSASLAYYTLFAIGPLLLVIITLLGYFYSKATITTEILDQVGSIIGTSATKELQSILTNMSVQPHSTLFGVVGGLVFVFGATGIFTEIQSSLNYIWSIKAKPKRGWLKYIKNRLLSLVLVIGMGLLMLVTIVVNVVIDLMAGHLQRYLGDANVVLLKCANIGLLFVITTFVFTIIFKVLPDARIHWKDALIGAAFTGVLFLIGKFLISYYLAMSKSINAYGAATSIIVVLTWVYYSAMILYFGAEFTEVYAKKWGRSITVNQNSVHVVRHETKNLEPHHTLPHHGKDH